MKNIFENSGITHQINADNPIYKINEKEFNQSLISFGVIVSILKNKRINQTMLLTIILEHENFRNCFKYISEINDDYTLISNLVIRFPILCKSKIVKNKIQELLHDNKRKTVL